MAGTVTNLIQGAGTLYVGDVGAAEPADTAVNTAPAGSAWADVGFTRDGVELSIAQEYSELEVDQLVDIPGRRLTKREFNLSTNLAEPTLDNLQLALNGSAPTTGAGFESFEPDNYEGHVEPNYKALLFDGAAPGGNVRRIVVRRALQTGNVDFAYSKGDQTVFSVEFAAHYVSTSVKPYKVIDETS